LLAQIFLVSGIGKLLDPAGTRQYMAAAGMPLTLLFLIGAIVFEFGGGLSLLVGCKARWGALALVLFLIPTTLIFHNILSDASQQANFMKNLGIMGGLLMIYAYGPGKWSIDERVVRGGKTDVAEAG
jgi:putative oxidoreductase